jgi:hypothetical protein
VDNLRRRGVLSIPSLKEIGYNALGVYALKELPLSRHSGKTRDVMVVTVNLLAQTNQSPAQKPA